MFHDLGNPVLVGEGTWGYAKNPTLKLLCLVEAMQLSGPGVCDLQGVISLKVLDAQIAGDFKSNPLATEIAVIWFQLRFLRCLEREELGPWRLGGVRINPSNSFAFGSFFPRKKGSSVFWALVCLKTSKSLWPPSSFPSKLFCNRWRRFGCDSAERSPISNRAMLLRFEIESPPMLDPRPHQKVTELCYFVCVPRTIRGAVKTTSTVLRGRNATKI